MVSKQTDFQEMYQMTDADKMKQQLQADKCYVDLGYNPMEQQMEMGMQDDWIGKNCDNPFKPINDENCIYKNANPVDYSSFKTMDKEEKMESKLECAYNKWKWEDKRAKTNPNKQRLEFKRKGKMLSSIKQICGNYKVLCSDKDMMGIPKDPDERCVETKACDDIYPSLSDIPEDIEYFAKLIFDIFDFGKYASNPEDTEGKNERKKRSKELDKEMKELKKEYKKLPKTPKSSGDFSDLDETYMTRCENKRKPGRKELRKNHVTYEGWLGKKNDKCFDPEEIEIIKKYINKRDEKTKIDPSFARKFGSMRRSISKGIGDAGRVADKLKSELKSKGAQLISGKLKLRRNNTKKDFKKYNSDPKLREMKKQELINRCKGSGDMKGCMQEKSDKLFTGNKGEEFKKKAKEALNQKKINNKSNKKKNNASSNNSKKNTKSSSNSTSLIQGLNSQVSNPMAATTDTSASTTTGTTTTTTNASTTTTTATTDTSASTTTATTATTNATTTGTTTGTTANTATTTGTTTGTTTAF